jgi:hypothetical protein
MLNKNLITKSLVIATIIGLFFGNVTPSILADIENLNLKKTYDYSFEQLDLQYIYNITENLSNIIFTEYNESNGEIAKGRAYGTIGEQKAAKIINKHMIALGLYTYTEQITDTREYPDLTRELEIIDFSVKINNKKIDSYIAPVWVETSENNQDLNHTYAYENLTVIRPPLNPSICIQKKKIFGTLEPFVVIVQDRAFYPYNPLSKIPFLDNFYFNYYVIRQLQGGIPVFYSLLWDNYLDYCKGIILYDFNEDVHDMNLLKNKNHIPFIYINKSDGESILKDIQNTRVDFTLTQHLNSSVISYNVIGQINGTDPTKTVIVDCLYDSWWCQGTADSAIGMAMVLAIAKYFKEKNIIPEYTMKFIGFSGEEHGFCAGSKHYASSHTDENIKYMIDVNQVGFKQDDQKLTLNIIGNNIGLLAKISLLIQKADYDNRVDSSSDLKYVWLKKGIVSNPLPFEKSHPTCEIICFLKDSGWKLHHRDGINHTEGDVLKYFDPEDVNVTGEIILNVVKYLATDY